ncbi:MAG TPA: Rpn family recombination-promoting nuclease/putative transposase [Anaerolineae bacterium]|nr:Rpn family recombination-promoting nuclease/putative transposase [Anaerolineae bacterium]
MTVQTPHDRFFRQTFSQVDIARNYLEEYLPANILPLFDLTHLELQADSFIDEELRQHQSDMLYRTRLTTNEDAYFYLLFEHKSYNDSLVALQLLRYMVRFWEQQEKAREPLQPIFPIVIHHGPQSWFTPTNFAALFTLPPAIEPYFPNFHYHLTDLSYRSNENIRGQIRLRIIFTILRSIFKPQLPQELENLLKLTFELEKQPQGVDFINRILYYLTNATGKVPTKLLRQALLNQGKQGERIMKTIAEQWKDELRDEVRDEVRDELRDEVRNELINEVRDQVRDEVRDQVRQQSQEETLQQVGWRLLNTFEVAQVSELMGVSIEKVIAWQTALAQNKANNQDSQSPQAN